MAWFSKSNKADEQSDHLHDANFYLYFSKEV